MILKIIFTFIIFCRIASAQTEKKPRVITINIGFDCLEFCTTLKGAEADFKNNQHVSQLVGAERTILIDNKTFETYKDKQTIVKLLQQQTANYDVVVFNYSGHGIPFPKTQAGANKPLSRQTDFGLYELLFISEPYGECVTKESSEEQMTCAADCGIKFSLDQCTAFAKNLENRCETIRDSLITKGLPYFEQEAECYDNVPANKKVEVDRCRQVLPQRLSCTSSCNSPTEVVRNYFTPIKDPLSAKNKACLDKYGILLSDLAPVFKGKKLFASIDTSNAALMGDIDHDDFVIATSTSFDEEAERFPSGGIFTQRKTQQLSEKYCKYATEGTKQITLTEHYQNVPDLWPFYVTPLVLTKQKTNIDLPLKGLYRCPQKIDRGTSPLKQETRK